MLMTDHFPPLVGPDGDPGSVRAGAQVWESWSGDLGAASERLSGLAEQFEVMQGEAVDAAQVRIAILSARTARLAQVLLEAAGTLRAYADRLHSGQEESGAALRADEDAHAQGEYAQRRVSTIRDDLRRCVGATRADDLQIGLSRQLTLMNETADDERAAVARLQRVHEDVADAATTAMRELEPVARPDSIPLSFTSSSAGTVPALASVASDLAEAADPDVDREVLDRVRALVAAHELDPEFCASLFFGPDSGANTYLALAVAGRLGDQEFVHQIVHAAALAGISRGELMTKVAYHQMRAWRASGRAQVIRSTMPPGGVPDPILGANVYGLLFLQFRPNGPWDAKPELDNLLDQFREKADYSWVDLGDHREIRYDVFGNVQFGYMMAEFGVPKLISTLGSHGPGAGSTDRGDDIAIDLGYKLREMYPNGITVEQFESYLTSPNVIRQLEIGEKVRGLS